MKIRFGTKHFRFQSDFQTCCHLVHATAIKTQRTFNIMRTTVLSEDTLVLKTWTDTGWHISRNKNRIGNADPENEFRRYQNARNASQEDNNGVTAKVVSILVSTAALAPSNHCVSTHWKWSKLPDLGCLARTGAPFGNSTK
jgi:hypothetical protein